MHQDITIKEISSFHLGGQPIHLGDQPILQEKVSGNNVMRRVDMNGTHVVGQLYVQQIRLANAQYPIPIMFWHGGGMTGAAWESTPDGRPGWQWTFLQKGHNVLVVDAVERGRASWAPYSELYAKAPIVRSKQEAWTLFRFGAMDGYSDTPKDRVPFHNQRFPIKSFDAFCAQLVPRWAGHDEMTLRAYDMLLQKVGPVHLIAHSQGGWLALNALCRARKYIQAIVLIEPSGAPTPTDALLREAVHIPHLILWGDFFEGHDQWKKYRASTEVYIQALSAAGGQVDELNLPALGIQGNSHLMMMDDNNQALAAVINQWLQQTADHSD